MKEIALIRDHHQTIKQRSIVHHNRQVQQYSQWSLEQEHYSWTMSLTPSLAYIKKLRKVQKSVREKGVFTPVENQHIESQAKVFLCNDQTSIYSWTHAYERGLWSFINIPKDKLWGRIIWALRNSAFLWPVCQKHLKQPWALSYCKFVLWQETTYKKFQVKTRFVYGAWNACRTI